MPRLCGCKEDCFVSDGTALCANLFLDEDWIGYCDKYDTENTHIYVSEEEYPEIHEQYIDACRRYFAEVNAFENLHFSKRLQIALDKVHDDDLGDETVWANRRYSEMSAWLDGDFVKGCFH